MELFFTWLKQKLKSKTFPGTSRNTILPQISTALIAMPVQASMKLLAKPGQSITQLQ